MLCIVCPPRGPDDPGHDPDYESGFLCCRRAWARMAGALRAIPELVLELSGLGYVERDLRYGTRAVRVGGKLSDDGRIVRVPHVADPIANVLPSGPVNGSKGSPRVNGSREAPVPIRIDPTDLLGQSRPASLAIAVSGLYASDQIGHLAVATELEFWARDWADIRREGIPLPNVKELAEWLLNRLDWACTCHPAIDEFAGKLRQMRSALTAAAGRFDAPVETLSAPCPDCDTLTLYRDTDIERVACGSCSMLFTEETYADYVQELIKENPS